jgi:hypothetical protein
LTKINERGFELPFCQILLSQGHRILRVGHSPYEDGKDIISIDRTGKVCAFQLKGGELDLETFEKHLAQIQALVQAAVDLPNVKTNKPHLPCLVVTGEISAPVLNRVKNLNVTWKRQKLSPLGLVGKRDLHQDFVKISENFWPVAFPDVRAFLGLYLANGEGDLDRKVFADQITKMLSAEKPFPKTVLSRRMAAANIYTSYVLGEFYKKEDHWSIFCAWMMCASCIAWAAERDKLADALWKSSFDLAFDGALQALGKLSAETLSERALFPREPELDDYTRARNTVALSAVAAWNLIQHLQGKRDDGLHEAVDLTKRFIKDARFFAWGENSVANFLSLFWFLENFTGGAMSERLPAILLVAICRSHAPGSTTAFADPYKAFDDFWGGKLEKAYAGQVPPDRVIAYRSYSLESLVLLLTRRLRRQLLNGMWSNITKVEMAEFRPEKPHDLLLWDNEKGEEYHMWPPRPGSWTDLKAKARTVNTETLPAVIKNNPTFALLFLLAYPHRIGTNLVQFLDHSLT